MNDRDLEKLERLAALVASGALTQEEYEVEKQRLLSAAPGEGGEQRIPRDDEPPQQDAPPPLARSARSRRPSLTSRWPIIAGLIGAIVLLGAGWLVLIKPQAPATTAAVEYTTTGSANVRDAPSATASAVVAELAADVSLGGEVVRGSDGRDWLKIAQGEYAGRYVWTGNLVRSGSAGADDRVKFVGLWAPNAETCGDGYEGLRLDANGTAVGWDTSGRWSVTQPGRAEVHWTSTGAGEDAEAMNERSRLALAGDGTTLRMDNTSLVKCSADQRPAPSVQPASASRFEPDSFPMQNAYRFETATIQTISGIGSTDARMTGKVTRADATIYCEADPNGEAASAGLTRCVDQVLRRESGRVYTASADCRLRRVTAPWGRSYLEVAAGSWRDADSGENPEDSGMASGYASIDPIWQRLCGR